MTAVEIAQRQSPATARLRLIATALNPNIAFMLWEAADREGDRPAIVERGRVTGYLSLRCRASAIASALVAAGVEPNDRVGIFLERGSEAAAAFFGVVAAGAIAVFVNETLRPRQIDHILLHAGVTGLLTSSELLARQPHPPATDAAILLVDAIPQDGDIQPFPRLGPDIAQIIYTSGSTGLAKGVVITHANLWAGVRAVTSYLGIRRDDRIASLLPFSFDYGCNQLLCAVATGATLVVKRSQVPHQIIATLRDEDVTVLAGVPPLWLRLLQVRGFVQGPLASLRVMTNTGGHLPGDAVAKLRAAHPRARLFLMYGLTEAFRATYLPPEQLDERPGSIGQAIPSSEILVLRDDLTVCAAEEVGELVQRGPTVAAGYWADPEATSRVFRPNPLRPAGAPDSERVVFSGDLVRRDAEGFLYYVGRRDRMIKTLGHRVSPDEVAEVLHASGEVAEAIVDAEPDEERGERIVAHVVLTPAGSVDRLKTFCRRELPRHMEPSRIEAHSTLPRTSTGKYDTAATRAPNDRA